MRIKEGRLRQLIREALLSEVPLDYIVSDEEPPPRRRGGDPSADDRRRFVPSIGHKTLKGPKNRKAAVEYFSKTGESWAIVTLGKTEVDPFNREMTETDPDFVDTDAFREKLRSWGIDPESTNVIVVIGVPFKGDYEGVRWNVIHDIVGHSIELEISYRWSHDIKQSDQFINMMVREVWDNLPESSKISGEDPGDLSADILAAIFLGNLSKADLDASALAGFDKAWDLHPMFMAHFKNNKEEAREWFVPRFVRTWTRAVEIWKGKFDREGGRVRAIIPFN